MQDGMRCSKRILPPCLSLEVQYARVLALHAGYLRESLLGSSLEVHEDIDRDAGICGILTPLE